MMKNLGASVKTFLCLTLDISITPPFLFSYLSPFLLSCNKSYDSFILTFISFIFYLLLLCNYLSISTTLLPDVGVLSDS